MVCWWTFRLSNTSGSLRSSSETRDWAARFVHFSFFLLASPSFFVETDFLLVMQSRSSSRTSKCYEVSFFSLQRRAASKVSPLRPLVLVLVLVSDSPLRAELLRWHPTPTGQHVEERCFDGREEKLLELGFKERLG